MTNNRTAVLAIILVSYAMIVRDMDVNEILFRLTRQEM